MRRAGVYNGNVNPSEMKGKRKRGKGVGERKGDGVKGQCWRGK